MKDTVDVQGLRAFAAVFPVADTAEVRRGERKKLGRVSLSRSESTAATETGYHHHPRSGTGESGPPDTKTPRSAGATPEAPPDVSSDFSSSSCVARPIRQGTLDIRSSRTVITQQACTPPSTRASDVRVERLIDTPTLKLGRPTRWKAVSARRRRCQAAPGDPGRRPTARPRPASSYSVRV
jgi:hypothetical protein